MSKPIFFDARGSRRRWSFRTLFALIGALLLAAAVFVLTILDVPAGSPLPIRYERAYALPLGDQVAVLRHRIDGGLRSIGWLPKHVSRGKPGGKPLTVGFYVPWDDASRVSLQAHLAQLDWVVPATFSIAGPQHELVRTADPRFDATIAGAERRPAVLPMVQNIANGTWDGDGAAGMLRNVAARRKLLAGLATTLDRAHAAGAVFDFESLPKESLGDYRAFLRDAHAAFAAHKLSVTLTVPVGDPDWDLRAFAHVADRVS